MHELNQAGLPTQLLCADASCVFLQGEAERAPSGEAEIGGEDYGSV